MPKKKHSELAAGAFVVAGLAGLLGVVMWLGLADLFRTRGQLVSFYVPQDAGSVGIVPGAELTCGDGRIGRVVEVQAAPLEGKCFYRVRLERADLTVKQDALAKVISPFVGQPKIVLLAMGKADQIADDQHPVPLTGGMDQAMGNIDKLALDLVAISGSLRDQLDPNKAGSLLDRVRGIAGEIHIAAKSVVGITGNIEAETKVQDANSTLGRVRRGAADINLATANIARQTDAKAKDTFMAKLDRAAGNIQAATDPNTKGSLLAKANGVMDGLDGVVKSGAPKIDRALTAVADAAERIDGFTKKDIAGILESFRQADTKIQKIAGDFAVVSEQTKQFVVLNRDNLDQMVENLAQVSVDLKSAAKDVRRNPWKLLREPTAKDARSENIDSAIRAFSGGAWQLEEALSKLRALQKISSDDPAFVVTMEKAKKSLQETFEKFSKVEKILWEELQK